MTFISSLSKPTNSRYQSKGKGEIMSRKMANQLLQTQIPKLSKDNYKNWCIQIKVLLDS